MGCREGQLNAAHAIPRDPMRDSGWKAERRRVSNRVESRDETFGAAPFMVWVRLSPML
jgi:hypothetical protein